MLAVQLGESANELVTKWGRRGYRYGFPDFYAAEFPVRPMDYDRSRIYSGVIGRHYPEAKTARYHYMFDPNMYVQPGVPASTGLGSGGFVARLGSDKPPVPGRYLVTARRVVACSAAVPGARTGRDCLTPEQFTGQGLPGDTTEAIGLDWEGLIESPFVWVGLGITAVAAGIAGGLIGYARGKRRVLRGR